jgi:hypothetical protein
MEVFKIKHIFNPIVERPIGTELNKEYEFEYYDKSSNIEYGDYFIFKLWDMIDVFLYSDSCKTDPNKSLHCFKLKTTTINLEKNRKRYKSVFEIDNQQKGKVNE